MSVVILFERCLTARIAKVTKLQKKPTSKWRPLPLTTVELQKLGSMYLRMDSQTVMKVLFSVLHVLRVSLMSSIDRREPVQQRLDQLSTNRNRFI